MIYDINCYSKEGKALFGIKFTNDVVLISKVIEYNGKSNLFHLNLQKERNALR